MKFRIILVAAAMVLGFSAAAFAQATFAVGSAPITTVTTCGHTERTGDITLTQIGGLSVAGTVTITYDTPITSPLANVGVLIKGIFPAGVPPAGWVWINPASNLQAKTLIINVPPGMAIVTFPDPPTIIVQGVRVAIADTGVSNVNASLTTTGNALIAGQTYVRVINGIAAGLSSASNVGTAWAANTYTGVTTGTPALRATEGYLDAFAYPESDTGIWTNVVPVMTRFTLSTAPPAGVTITFPGSITASNGKIWQTASSAGVISGAAVALTSTSGLSVHYISTTTTDPTLAEYITVYPTIGIVAPVSAAAGSTITVTATLAPVGTAYDIYGNIITTPIPRFKSCEVPSPAILLVTFNPGAGKTTLLVPYAAFKNALGYNTGLSIANTTIDPGNTAMGTIGGVATPSATSQSGTMTFYFYKQLPTPGGTLPAVGTYTTGATSPGTGLNAAGELPAGSTYIVLISQLLEAASITGDFDGYIFVVTNFTNAHCLYAIISPIGDAYGALALVVAGDRKVTPEGLNN